MEQFNLDTWLQDKSRKVVTRDGRVVKILDTEFESGNGNKSILAKCIYNGKAVVYLYTVDGRANNLGETENDLFFVDEEEELTEFEKEVKDLINSCCNEIGETIVTNEWAKDTASALLDLARKELQPDFDEEMDKMLAETDKVVYQKRREDALKSLPKWKKATEDKEFDRYVILLDDEDRVVLTTEIYKDEYYIELPDLKFLPKEE